MSQPGTSQALEDILKAALKKGTDNEAEASRICGGKKDLS